MNMDIIGQLLEKCISKYKIDKNQSHSELFPQSLVIFEMNVDENNFESMKDGFQLENVRQKYLYENDLIQRIPVETDYPFVRKGDRFWSISYASVGFCSSKAFLCLIHGPRWGCGYEYSITSESLKNERQIWIS